MTTLPERLITEWFKNNLLWTLKIANNSIVVLNIPYKSLKNKPYVIPKDIQELVSSKFIINRCDNDYGPITKLLPILQSQHISEDSIIMICDDDIKYHEKTFELLEKSVRNNLNSVSSMCSTLIEGFKGFGFIKKLLINILDIKIPSCCIRIDDNVIQTYIKFNNIPVISVENKFKTIKTKNFSACSTYDTTEHPEWDELKNDNREEIYNNCIPALLQNLIKNTKRIFDCFQCSTGEEDLLLLRIMITSPYVYKYIIIDSDESHSGIPKKLVDLSNIPHKFRDKIIYINCKFPNNLKQDIVTQDNEIAWNRERYQRDKIFEILSQYALDNDICYISDLDEIPFYDRIIDMISKEGDNIFYLHLPTYVFNIHFIVKDYEPDCGILSNYKYLVNKLKECNYSLTDLRFKGTRNKKGGINIKNWYKNIPVRKGCTMHLNRFINPYDLIKKEDNMVEKIGKYTEHSIIDIIRRYFYIVCMGQDGKKIKTVHYRKKVVNNPDVHKDVYKYLHIIHSMKPKELTKLYNKVQKIPDEKLQQFTHDFFYNKYGIMDNIENPYFKGSLLLWPDKSYSKFLNNNFPSQFEFDFDIKKHIFDTALSLPKNYCIIDCGAHIGDGSIPLADALTKSGRSDIIIYAIDPGIDKINFILNMIKVNNLMNIKILNCGLSDKTTKYFPKLHQPDIDYDKNNINTGGTQWTSDKYNYNYEEKPILFEKLDNLVINNIISEKIGYIHLDVETMEPNAINGGLQTIKYYKPVLSIEEHDLNSESIKNILEPLGYNKILRINSNNIYK
jgi:FkbM family methyltransferase